LKQGLYTPQLESDACGTGLIARLDAQPTHRVVQDALVMLENMEHRGAAGCEANSGDGAGMLVQIPHDFMVKVTRPLGFELPAFGEYGVGMVFFPKIRALRERCRILFNDYIDELGFECLGYRPVPTNNSALGPTACSTEPVMEQVFLRPLKSVENRRALERRLYVLRKFAHHAAHTTFPEVSDDFYIASLSYKTIVYKGQLTAGQLRGYYPDLADPDFCSAVALIHSRFSTNTVPRWRLAQPFRYVAHNGEINTIQGNVNWWRSKEPMLHSEVFNDAELEQLKPICGPGLSDSGIFDNVLEFLVMDGRSVPHSLMMMVPEAWQQDNLMEDHKRAFYEYHSLLMEPWDGPAAMCFTDGIVIGATLDRNGLRPLRWQLTKDNMLVLASEAGALPLRPEEVVQKGRLQPGRMLIADLDQQRIIADEEVKNIICKRFPYRDWLDNNRLTMNDLLHSAQIHHAVHKNGTAHHLNGLSGSGYGHYSNGQTINGDGQHLHGNGKPERANAESTLPKDDRIDLYRFGYTREDVEVVLKQMAIGADEPVGSMGSDTPLAVLSHRPQHLANYFKQLFAQVTNPPIDSIRERSVMSLFMPIGGTKNVLDLDKNHAHFIHLDSPVLSEIDFDKLSNIGHPRFKVAKIQLLFTADNEKGRLKAALDRLCAEVEHAVRAGSNLIILSDRLADEKNAPIPSLMGAGAIHHHLIRQGIRNRASLIIDTGEAWETHHFAALIGFGANAICPWLAYRALKMDQTKEQPATASGLKAADLSAAKYRKAVDKGLLKIMSKIGISTVQSYCGAQTFEAVGIAAEVIDFCFHGTISRLGGLSFDEIAEEALSKHAAALIAGTDLEDNPDLPLTNAGIWQWQKDGEYHLFNPQTIHLLQRAVREGRYDVFKQYSQRIDNQAEKSATLRGLLDFRKGHAIPIEEVEPIENILKRFASGAMSFGSISHEAHSTLAIAMNRIGGRSNSGEGGEDACRSEPLDPFSEVILRYEPEALHFTPQPGDSARSKVRQVASGRFGVTIDYLAGADELQIKMAQGAKPGEGGQLPGYKVDEWIAKTRHSTPGVGLISPPPHHDIYSIEDLAQLIFDLKNANDRARISVKLVAKAGVGIIASGVAKAKADVILISGHDGGTGASPLTSIRHAGLPWEMGLAEAHQTLVRNRMRDRVVLQSDGQVRTGRDLAIATLLGAQEWGIATAALVAEGCILMRKCHVNTCPVGIATQNPELRKRFGAKPEHVVNMFTFLAHELREIMAQLGFRTVNEMVGRVEMLKAKKEFSHWKYRTLDLSPILYSEPIDWQTAAAADTETPLNKLNSAALTHDTLDVRLLATARLAIENDARIQRGFHISNTDRAVGTMLSSEIARQRGGAGLPDGTIQIHFTGSAGQSFGAFLAPGVQFLLEGEANDYFGKGLSGGRLTVMPSRKAIFEPADNILIGNVALYGATGGEAFIEGMAGERFAVRNSGARAVVEGTGDHGCEYMTGGIVTILGRTGSNFAAGMTGGTAFVYDPDGSFPRQCNMDNVEIEATDEEDLQTIRYLIRRHLYFTGSRRALTILNNWSESSRHFKKVVPKDLKSLGIRITMKDVPQRLELAG